MTALATKRHAPTAAVELHAETIKRKGHEEISSMSPTLGRAELAAAEREIENLRRAPVASRLALLGVVLAELQGVDFDDIARLLKVKPNRLERMMHGRESLPKTSDERWLDVANLLRLLHGIIKPPATGRWLNTQIPSLGGITPLDAIERGRFQDVYAVVERYRQSSFS